MTCKNILLFFVALFQSLPLFACEEIRAAFDVGSSNTKMRIYAVDTCTYKSIEQIEQVGDLSCEAQEEIRYKEDVEKFGLIKHETLAKGVETLQKMKSLAKQCGATQFAGVATSAFRQASNKNEAKSFLSQSGINISVITQSQEASLEFYGALSKNADADIATTCVWGIGGSSMQITCDNNGTIESYLGQVASVSFKKIMINTQQCPGFFPCLGEKPEKESPNPISLQDYNNVNKFLSRESKKILKTFPNQLSSKRIIGIGGVHYYSVSKALDQKTYTKEDLLAYLQTKLDKTDDELGGGKYVDTSVSNLVLVHQLMTELTIEQVHASNVNLTEGLVASHSYWQ